MFGIILNNAAMPDHITGLEAYGEIQTLWKSMVKRDLILLKKPKGQHEAGLLGGLVGRY
jgi:hypothetical protein